ncbi:MAG: succinate dehydrogenase cytochrome b subunit [Bacteroidetes bacterium]|nr:succinate dehydrogenase cytochrome b subunit [Bacteroidota bacterium]
MSITGLFLMLFLLVHVTANMTSLFGPAIFNRVCDFMGTNPIIMIVAPVLAVGMVVHILYALWLSLYNLRARGKRRYAVYNKGMATSWASKNMLALGSLIAGGMALHLIHFWSQMQLREILGGVGADPYQLLVYQFSRPYVVFVYMIWIIALWFHLTHGFWSAFQSLGLNNTNWIKRWQTTARVFATVVAAGFTSIPIYFFFKPTGLL